MDIRTVLKLLDFPKYKKKKFEQNLNHDFFTPSEGELKKQKTNQNWL